MTGSPATTPSAAGDDLGGAHLVGRDRGQASSRRRRRTEVLAQGHVDEIATRTSGKPRPSVSGTSVESLCGRPPPACVEVEAVEVRAWHRHHPVDPLGVGARRCRGARRRARGSPRARGRHGSPRAGARQREGLPEVEQVGRLPGGRPGLGVVGGRRARARRGPRRPLAATRPTAPGPTRAVIAALHVEAVRARRAAAAHRRRRDAAHSRQLPGGEAGREVVGDAVARRRAPRGASWTRAGWRRGRRCTTSRRTRRAPRARSGPRRSVRTPPLA